MWWDFIFHHCIVCFLFSFIQFWNWYWLSVLLIKKKLIQDNIFAFFLLKNIKIYCFLYVEHTSFVYFYISTTHKWRQTNILFSWCGGGDWGVVYLFANIGCMHLCAIYSFFLLVISFIESSWALLTNCISSTIKASLRRHTKIRTLLCKHKYIGKFTLYSIYVHMCGKCFDLNCLNTANAFFLT